MKVFVVPVNEDNIREYERISESTGISVEKLMFADFLRTIKEHRDVVINDEEEGDCEASYSLEVGGFDGD